MKQVTIRLSEEDVALLAELEEKMGVDRAEVLRQLISQGLQRWRGERALEELEDHGITIRTAAEQAGVSYLEMLTLAAEAGVDVGYDADDLERDLDRL